MIPSMLTLDQFRHRLDDSEGVNANAEPAAETEEGTPSEGAVVRVAVEADDDTATKFGEGVEKVPHAVAPAQQAAPYARKPVTFAVCAACGLRCVRHGVCQRGCRAPAANPS